MSERRINGNSAGKSPVGLWRQSLKMTQMTRLQVMGTPSRMIHCLVVKRNFALFFNGGGETAYDTTVWNPDVGGRPSTAEEDPTPEVNNKNEERRRWRKKSQSMEEKAFRPDQIEDASTTTNIVDAFLMFYDDETIGTLVFEINRYCTQKGKVGNILKDEMYVFFRINVMMGYDRLPSLCHYWMNGDDMGVCAIQRAMTRDRFQ